MNASRRILHPENPNPASASRCALALVTKAPRAGDVKTRLSPPLTAEEAATLNVCFLRDMATSIGKAGREAQGIACFTPAGAAEFYRDILPEYFQLIAQRDGELGARLIGAVEDLLAVGFAGVCLINSDSPTVPATVFAEAVQILASPGQRIVLGPSDDGGYYLIGMRQLHSRLFEDIAWSTEQVLVQTHERATEVGLEVHLLPACYDVDDRKALEKLCRDLLGPEPSIAPDVAPATRAFLRELVAREGRERMWSTVSA